MIEPDLKRKATPAPFDEVRIRVRDGIGIYGRRYPAPGSTRRPLLCLAGLTRNSRDFHSLALALSSGPRARPVYTLDYRGRGLSSWGTNWHQYTIPAEMFDVQDFMAAHQLHDTAILGTSRGGLIAMIMAAAQPSLVGAVVLNDVGPVIEIEGLLRISTYIGGTVPVNWADAADRLERIGNSSFPDLHRSDWEPLARQWYNEKDGKPVLAYDPALAKTLSILKSGRIPKLWPQFGALGRVPCLVLRGELSDVLSEATALEMSRRHPRCQIHTVSRQGHAPLLLDAPTQTVVADFLDGTDAN